MRKMLTRLLSVALVALLVAPPVAWAGPRGERVVAGDVRFRRNGDTTVVRASDGSIIDYRSLSVDSDETLRFVQPGAQARVLNRVLGPDATRIDGALLANGQVYIVNRAGVFFGGDAVVDVSRLVAAGGDIRNEDFLAGVDRFELTGPVEVASGAEIRALEGAALLGTSVANAGRILAREGALLLVAGETVYLGEHGSHVLVKLSGPAGSADGAAVSNDGVLDAGRGAVRLAAGDAVGLAVRNTGTLRGRELHLDGGAGEVRVSGRLDASDAAPGATGGHVEVRGDVVLLEGATLDASGDAGGGTILVGGDVQGRGEGRNASVTRVDAESTLRADALRGGDGGSVVVWADGAAGVYGELSARGGAEGGDGGFVETSGKRLLDVDTTPDVTAPHGSGGTWLLDPANIRIVKRKGTLDVLDFRFAVSSPVAQSTVGVDRLVDALEAGSSVFITTQIFESLSDPIAEGTAPGDITIATPILLDGIDRNGARTGATSASLTLAAARHIIVDHEIDADATDPATEPPSGIALSLNFVADDANQRGGGNGVGDVVLNADVDTNGGDFSSSGVGFTLAPGTSLEARDGGVAVGHTGSVHVDGAVGGDFGVTLAAGTDGSGNLVLGANGPASIRTDELLLSAGDGSRKRAIVDIQNLAITGSGGAGTSPEAFSLLQDDDLTVDGTLAVFGGAPPETVELLSRRGTVTVDDASAISAAGATDLSIEGETVALNAPLAAADLVVEGDSVSVNATVAADTLALRHRGALHVTQALADRLDAPELTLAADVDGTSDTRNAATTEDLTFDAGVTLGATNTLSHLALEAGDGAGRQSGKQAAVDAVTGAPTFVLPAKGGSFALRQDAAIEGGDVPAAAQFAGGLPERYELRANHGPIEIATASDVGLETCTPPACTGGPDVNLTLVTPGGIALPDLAQHEYLDLGDNTFVWRSPSSLTVTSEISKLTADTVVLHAGSEQPLSQLSFDVPVGAVRVQPGDDSALITLNAREVHLVAGDGAGGSTGSSIDARARLTLEVEDADGNLLDTLSFLQPYFRGPQGATTLGSPDGLSVLIFEQDAAITASDLVRSLPAASQFATGGPSDRLELRANETALSGFALVVDDFAPLLLRSDGNPTDLVLAAPGVSIESAPGERLDLAALDSRVRVRADAVRFLGIDRRDRKTRQVFRGSVDASVDGTKLELAAFDGGSFDDGNAFTPGAFDDDPMENPGTVIFDVAGDIALDPRADLPDASTLPDPDVFAGDELKPDVFVPDQPIGVLYQLVSREGDVDLTGDGAKLAKSVLVARAFSADGEVRFSRVDAGTGNTVAADLDLAGLVASSLGDMTVGSQAKIVVSEDPADDPENDFESARGRISLTAATLASRASTLRVGDAELSAPEIELIAGSDAVFGTRGRVAVEDQATLTLANNDTTIAHETELLVAQDLDLTDTDEIPLLANFASAPDRYTLRSRAGSLTLSDPSQFAGMDVVAQAPEVVLARAAGGGDWDFASDFQSLSIQSAFDESLSPAALRVEQDGDLAGASLPEASSLASGPAGVRYTVRSRAGDVRADDDLATRTEGSFLSLDAGDRSVRLASDLDVQTLEVRSPATLEADVKVRAEELEFASTLDSSDRVAGEQSFEVAGARRARFGGDVGVARPLASLRVRADRTRFPGARRVVARGDVELGRPGRSQVPTAATIGKARGDLRIESLDGSVIVERNEKLTVGGRLALVAEDTVRLADTNALDLRVDAARIEVERRRPGQVETPNGESVGDPGVDVVANRMRFSTTPVAVGRGADPVFGLADPRTAPSELDGFAVAAARADGGSLRTAHFTGATGRLLDARPGGAERTNLARIYANEAPRPTGARPSPVRLASFADAGGVGIEPREPSPQELLEAARGVVVYDDVARGRSYALLDEAVADVAAPPARAEGSAAGEAAGPTPAPREGSGAELPAPPVPVSEPRLEADVVDRAAELYARVFGADGSNAPDIRATLAEVVERYKRETGARRVYGFELRRYIRNRPSSQFEAYRTLRELDLLFRVHRRSGLAPGEYRRIQEAWLRRIQPEGISLEELAEMIHPSGKRRSGDILDIFGE